MNKQQYREYLQSYEWHERREDKLWDAGYRCERCGDDSFDVQLDVHHLTYERVGNERPSDLQVLCRACHKRAHPPSPPKRNSLTMKFFGQAIERANERKAENAKRNNLNEG